MADISVGKIPNRADGVCGSPGGAGTGPGSAAMGWRGGVVGGAAGVVGTDEVVGTSGVLGVMCCAPFTVRTRSPRSRVAVRIQARTPMRHRRTRRDHPIDAENASADAGIRQHDAIGERRLGPQDEPDEFDERQHESASVRRARVPSRWWASSWSTTSSRSAQRPSAVAGIAISAPTATPSDLRTRAA